MNFGEKEAAYAMQIIYRLRHENVNAELYPDVAKMKKQMSYANAKNIPFVVMTGEEEMNERKVTLKDMETGEQTSMGIDDLIERMR